jgi:hypothetical protein
MTILNTYSKFKRSIFSILKSKPKYFYLSTFNISIDEDVRDMLKQMKGVKDVKILIGVNDPSPKQISFLKNTFRDLKIPMKLVTNHHMKIILSDSKAIIGGRNLTGSEWTDLSFETTYKNHIAKLKEEFEIIYKKAKNIW